MTLWKHLSQLLSILRISICPNYFNRKCILMRWLTNACVTFETRTCFDVYFICSNHQNRPCINYWFRIPTNAYIVIRTFEQRPCHVRSLQYKCMRQAKRIWSRFCSNTNLLVGFEMKGSFLSRIFWCMQIKSHSKNANSS